MNLEPLDTWFMLIHVMENYGQNFLDYHTSIENMHIN